MKRQDLGLLIVVVFVSVILSVVISKLLITAPKNRQEAVEVVEPISAEFNQPKADDKNFNKNAIDPTQTITIDANSNNKPFKKQ